MKIHVTSWHCLSWCWIVSLKAKMSGLFQDECFVELWMETVSHTQTHTHKQARQPHIHKGSHARIHTYLRMKPPLMAICSRSSTTRAPGWLFTTPSWFPPQAWPPPLILPHTHFSQGQRNCFIVCVWMHLCVCVYACVCVCLLVSECNKDSACAYLSACWLLFVTVCMCVQCSVNVYMHVCLNACFKATHN